MPYHIQWWIDDCVIFAEVKGHLNDELSTALNEDLTCMISESTSPRVCLVMKDDEMVGLPGDSLRAHRDTMTAFSNPKIERTVGVGDVNAAVRFLQTVINRAFGMQTKRVHTVDEAMEYLRQIEPSLTEKPANPLPQVDALRT